MSESMCSTSASLFIAALAVWMETPLNALLIMSGVTFVIAVAASMYEGT
jgi:hypothetical protein